MDTMTARVGQRNPFVFTLALRAHEAEVVLARDLVSTAFGQWGLERLDYNGRLVMSELVTNAVRACKPDGEIFVRVYLKKDGRPVIEVWDSSPELPVFQDVGPVDVGGRGLFIVDHLVAELVVRPIDGGQGKVVRAVMDAQGTSGPLETGPE